MSRRWVYIVLLAVYAVALSVITLRAQHPGTGASATWVPLTGIWHLLTESEGNTYLDVGSGVGNIVLFVPLGCPGRGQSTDSDQLGGVHATTVAEVHRFIQPLQFVLSHNLSER